MSKIKLANGVRIEHGQLHMDPRRKDRSAPIGFGRKFGQKEYATPALAGGMRDVSATGHNLAFVGGKNPLDDETLQKSWEGMATTPGMHNRSGTGGKIPSANVRPSKTDSIARPLKH